MHNNGESRVDFPPLLHYGWFSPPNLNALNPHFRTRSGGRRGRGLVDLQPNTSSTIF